MIKYSKPKKNQQGERFCNVVLEAKNKINKISIFKNKLKI